MGSRTGKDEFLLQCIDGALSTASQLRPHGTARFRLEKLLETSPDILKRFEEKRGGSGREPTAGVEHATISHLADTSLIYVEV